MKDIDYETRWFMQNTDKWQKDENGYFVFLTNDVPADILSYAKQVNETLRQFNDTQAKLDKFDRI